MEGYINKRQRYYNSEEEFRDIRLNLKINPCPHCRERGCLILHGYLYGYGEGPGSKRRKRGHRIFCSNRRKKNDKGCGRTFSILLSCVIKKYITSAISLWKFLDNISEDKSLIRALRSTSSNIQEAGIYSIFNKFQNRQADIRTRPMSLKDPPALKHTRSSVIQTIQHLRSVFKESVCPVPQFQYHFQTSFI